MNEWNFVIVVLE